MSCAESSRFGVYDLPLRLVFAQWLLKSADRKSGKRVLLSLLKMQTEIGREKYASGFIPQIQTGGL